MAKQEGSKVVLPAAVGSEDASERSEAWLRSILSAVEGWILTVDLAGRIRYANRPFPGATHEEMSGTLISVWIRESMREGFQGLLEAAIVQQRGGSIELQARDEPHRWLDCRISPLIRNGELAELILSFLDIDKRKRAETERERLLTEMQNMKHLESLGVLAGGIAHDFNNLLTGVLGNASLAGMKLPADSEVQPFLTVIEQTVEQAAELCQQMLAFAGKGNFVSTTIGVSELVQGLVKILRGELTGKAELQLELASGLPEIRCDPTQLRRVVMQLITNASDALDGDGGAIYITTGCRDFTAAELCRGHWSEPVAPGTYTFIAVRDTGHGMDALTLSKIYQPFFSTKFLGRGLGLAAASGMVRSHGGAIYVESEAGVGTTFMLVFPSRRAVSQPEVEIQGGHPGEQAATVLLADDEEVVAQVARQTLETAGFSVLLARDGRQALEIFERHQQAIAVAVLDMTMPEITGAELLQRFRHQRAELPVLLSSGFSEQDLSDRLGGQRWTAFIKKPYRPKELLSAVRQALAADGGLETHALNAPKSS